jgi:uncharacterized protein
MDHTLLDILVCPICKSRLQVTSDKSGLICRADRLVFGIEDGIPIMLESAAKSLDEDNAGSVASPVK